MRALTACIGKSNLLVGSIAAFLLSSPGVLAREPPQVWFAPMQPTIRADGSHGGSIDYFQLFEPTASWDWSASHVSVFKIYPETLRDATDEQVRRLVEGLSRRHIKLGMEGPVIGLQCAPDSGPEWVVNLAARLKRLGGDLSEFAMVGPVVDGHASLRVGACHRSFDQIARAAAHVIAELRGIYPKVLVGDIESYGSGAGYLQLEYLSPWFDAWLRTNGTSLQFLHLDIVWGTPWQAGLMSIAQRTRAAGVRFGVIYKGDPSDLSDASFTDDALLHANEVESALSGTPDDVILQSWENYPRHALPDSDFSTMTGLVRAYLRPETRLERKSPDQVRLVRADGTAIKEADLIIEADDDRRNAMNEEVIAGVVPHTAAYAIPALRVHTECACSKVPASLSIAGYEFRSGDDGAIYQGDVSKWSSPASGVIWQAEGAVSALKIEVGAAQSLMLNGPSLAVLPDESFRLAIRTHIESGSDGAGFFAVVFQDHHGREVQRSFRFFRATWQEVARTKVASDGTSPLPQLRNYPNSRVRVRFEGNLTDRPTVLDLNAAADRPPVQH